MQITNVRRSTREGREPMDTLALFDLQITPSFKVKNLMLRQRGDGSHFICAPKAFGTSTCTFMPDVARGITAAALKEYRNLLDGASQADENASGQ